DPDDLAGPFGHDLDLDGAPAGWCRIARRLPAPGEHDPGRGVDLDEPAARDVLAVVVDPGLAARKRIQPDVAAHPAAHLLGIVPEREDRLRPGLDPNLALDHAALDRRR